MVGDGRTVLLGLIPPEETTEPSTEPKIIPEFPSWTPLLFMVLVVTIIGIVYKRRLHSPNH